MVPGVLMIPDIAKVPRVSIFPSASWIIAMVEDLSVSGCQHLVAYSKTY